MVPATTPLIGFNREIIWPLRQILLPVKIGDAEHSTSTWMNFVVVISPSPYNGIIGRPRVRKIQAIPSTAHEMLKFLVPGEILTLRSSRIVPLECMMVSGMEAQPSSITQAAEERIRVAVHSEYPGSVTPSGASLERPRRMPSNAGIMKEVHYHNWLSNPVMVKKRDDSWRMCVDFEDLNKACLKDGYLLPEIDWKNVGATYQRLVDKALQKQIGRNLEVYVDDLVIKSRTKQEKIRDIEETFRTLREINMKLNPKKCTFGVEEGMFLGYKGAKAAFKQMKKLIAELPTLTAPMEKEELVVYLAAAREAVSAVLMTERVAKQMPVYFVSRALTSVKGQILEDFIVERPEDDFLVTTTKSEEELSDPWTLFTDGSSYIDGFGAGLILINHEGT
ncbi:reverse transcriptase domain-containing protein [Tanacetum coccineum]|uniref:Reverse transcriptase domain-containing protein n=1 Tax=Tanacetum coccineum TaxID=301880 RepID=A0ABQ5FJK9_9ASTR